MSDGVHSEEASSPLIVIGASAGGVEALSRLVATLPAGLPAPLVIAQHLDPSRQSHLGEILAHHTAIPVHTVVGREALTPGTIFVVPANRHVVISDHHVEVHTDATRRPTPLVDLLLSTAATTFGERLIAVILTGSGSDGAAGAHAVKEAGGTVIIQDPATAAFPAMPRALAPSLVDVSAPLERIGSVLADLLRYPVDESPESQGDLDHLLQRLRVRHGIDFSAYKPATIQRRLTRRMAGAGVETIADYFTYLEDHPEEEQRLIADFLIKVTRFFRDPALFAKLREEIIPELIRTAQSGTGELRLWSAGCATGEEAYSLALLVADAMADRPEALPVRIFATDVDEAALNFARRGIYPVAALADVPPELMAKYITPLDGSFEVSRELRSLIVFGTHDLAQRPPFPRTDLILCRNVLIYFTHELQRRAMEIFAFSLRDDGYLALGQSETVGRDNDHFAVVDRRVRLYRRQGGRAALLPRRSGASGLTEGEATPVGRSQAVLEVALRQAEEATIDARRLGERAEEVLRRLPAGVVVVDHHYDIKTLNAAARTLLGIPGVAVGQDLIHLLPATLATPVRIAVDAVLAAETPSSEVILTTETVSGDPCHLRLHVQAERTGDESVTHALLVVTDVTELVEAERVSTEGATRSQDTIARLGQTNRQLQAANRELTGAIDRLREQGDELREAMAATQVSGEEIETLNEELQASNEELETLHEEAQATVEELNVANDELQARAIELEEQATTRSIEQARITALLESMGEAVLVVDQQARIVRTNAAYEALLTTLGGRWVPADEHGLPLPAAERPERRAAQGETFQLTITAETPERTRHWLEVVGRPLSGKDAGILVVRDITDRTVRRLQEEFLTWAGHELRTPLTALMGFLQLAERQLGSGNAERLQRFLHLAITEARRQEALVTELIDATRLYSGKLQLQRAPLDLGQLAVHVVELAQVLAVGQMIVLEASDEPLVMAGDTGRLEQVLLNLLTNAITHAPGTERIIVRLRNEGCYAELTVQDEGPGIPAEALETIFEQFTQIDPQQRPGRAGLGLGLYIARQIVDAHGGTLTAHSATGFGATFTVRLPLLTGLRTPRTG